MTSLHSKSAVKRHWLYIFSGLLWSIAGSILIWRSIVWLSDLPSDQVIIISILGTLLAIIFFFTGFIKIARKNTKRLASLPERASIFRFASRRSYFIIAAMITLGIVLRNSSLPKQYLTVLYAAMGGALWMGSILFYKTWFNIVREL
jgi:hypothetical protein